MALVGLMWKFRVYPHPDRGPEASSTWSVVPEVHPDKKPCVQALGRSVSPLNSVY